MTYESSSAIRDTTAFYIPTPNGEVDANEPLDTQLRHAVVTAAIGERSGSRYILIRNSWGTSWGSRGYAWMAESYMAPRIIEVIALKKVA